MNRNPLHNLRAGHASGCPFNLHVSTDWCGNRYFWGIRILGARMRRPYITLQFLSLVACICLPGLVRSQERNWTNFVRIGAYGLTSKNAAEIVRDAAKDHVFGIEVDNDIPGRYESLLDPAEKLKDVRSVAEAAHNANNKAFVYIAGTECITANADKSPIPVVKIIQAGCHGKSLASRPSSRREQLFGSVRETRMCGSARM